MSTADFLSQLTIISIDQPAYHFKMKLLLYTPRSNNFPPRRPRALAKCASIDLLHIGSTRETRDLSGEKTEVQSLFAIAS